MIKLLLTLILVLWLLYLIAKFVLKPYLRMLRYAKYNGAVAKRSQIKPVQSSAKPTRPGNASNVSQKSSAAKKSQQRLAKTGNIKDAASLLEKFL